MNREVKAITLNKLLLIVVYIFINTFFSIYFFNIVNYNLLAISKYYLTIYIGLPLGFYLTKNQIKKGYKRKPLLYYNTMIQNSTPGHTYVFNRELAEIVCEPNPSKIYVHDSYILNAAVICGEVIYDPLPHTSYRQHSSNQLGTSNRGLVSWTKSRLKRLRRGDGKQYATQIEYIYNTFFDKISFEQRKETDRFLKNRKMFITRLMYAANTKFYRQRTIENIAFRILYVVGGYNLKKN